MKIKNKNKIQARIKTVNVKHLHVNAKKIQEKSIRDNSSRREIAKEILKGLALGGLVVASFALPNLPQIFSLLGIDNAKERYRARRAIQSFKKQKLLEIYEDGDEQIVKITEAGKKRVARYKFDEIKLTRPAKWDGYWRVLSFDIPERFKKGRDALTRKLNEMEVYPLQKSLFVCPFECKDEIDFIGEIFGIRNFIHFFLVKSIDERDEELLKRHYNL